MELIDYLSEESLAKAGITLAELTAIREDFGKKAYSYEQAAKSVTDTLLAAASEKSGVHSARYRVKDSSHLIDKIARKRYENKTRVITLNNYEQEVTDLAGVRVLHLFKEDWRRIHRFITETWTLHETPIAYYRRGDPAEVLAMFTEQQCETKEHPRDYRSVHYLVKTSLTRAELIVEIQVRTLFEEGWGEVDHQIRYPNFSDNTYTNSLLSYLNRLAGSADEISAIVQNLHYYLQGLEQESKDSQREQKEQIEKLQQVISDLQLSEHDRSRLEGAIKSVSKTPANVEVNKLPGFAHVPVPLPIPPAPTPPLPAPLPIPPATIPPLPALLPIPTPSLSFEQQLAAAPDAAARLNIAFDHFNIDRGDFKAMGMGDTHAIPYQDASAPIKGIRRLLAPNYAPIILDIVRRYNEQHALDWNFTSADLLAVEIQLLSDTRILATVSYGYSPANGPGPWKVSPLPTEIQTAVAKGRQGGI